MYGKPFKRETVYALFVYANVVSILGAGQGAYDMTELAAACGLKPTHNFKRRVMQLVDQGIVIGTAAFTERGGMKAVFTLPDVVMESEPF